MAMNIPIVQCRKVHCDNVWSHYIAQWLLFPLQNGTPSASYVLWIPMWWMMETPGLSRFLSYSIFLSLSLSLIRTRTSLIFRLFSWSNIVILTITIENLYTKDANVLGKPDEYAVKPWNGKQSDRKVNNHHNKPNLVDRAQGETTISRNRPQKPKETSINIYLIKMMTLINMFAIIRSRIFPYATVLWAARLRMRVSVCVCSAAFMYAPGQKA